MTLRRSARVSAVGLKNGGHEPTLSIGGSTNTDRNGVKKSRGSTKASLPASKSKISASALSKSPATPKVNSRRGALKPNPITPTPSAIGLMTAPYSSGDIDDATPPPPVDRPAEPHRTNAPLISPETSRLVAYSNEVIDSSPSKARLPRPNTSTSNILEEACAHLIKVDPKLKPVIDKHYCRIFSPEGLAEEIDPFRSLTSGILAQQVSGAAAKAIKNRFIALFNGENPENQSHSFPTPSQVVASDVAHLRTAGLSGRKAEYVIGLAEKFASGELSADLLVKASDEEVLEKLTAVRGLGKWSVEMFACFGLKRMDVLSTGDLGVQRGMAAYVGRDVSKLKAKGGGKWKYMSEKDMLDISAKFAPYRSLFMWYMWRIEDVDVTAVQDN
ncbi:MAG: 3-methyladenine DNA glycosylase [Piccolia ochrophora]|nr:MAG: 3-methyladenine DNA glycosylase [Piccolia ochrophora]